MDISKLAKKPTLIELKIDDKDTIDTYGEPVTFYMMDQMDLVSYFAFYKVQKEENSELLNQMLRKIILTSEGKPALGPEDLLPVDLTLAVLVKIGTVLGKSKPKDTSTSMTETPAS